MMNKLFFVLLLFLTVGCSTKSNYYVLSHATQPSKVNTTDNSIGVEQVILPSYMDKRKLTVATSNNQIIQLNSVLWAEDMDAGLSQRIISFLQKKFNQPNVFGYPWGVDAQPDIKVKLQVNRFLAQGNKVYLDANYVITDLATKQSRAYLFNTTVPATDDAEVIVRSMDKAFGKLEEEIASKIK